LVRVILSPDLQRCANGARQVTVSATSYQELVTELLQRFPAMTAAVVGKHAIAVDGLIIQAPLLETFGGNSELVFFPRISGG